MFNHNEIWLYTTRTDQRKKDRQYPLWTRMCVQQQEFLYTAGPRTSNSIRRYRHHRNVCIYSPKGMYKHVHNSTIQISQRLEITRRSWDGVNNLWHEWKNMDESQKLDLSSQTRKSTCHMISFLECAKTGKTHLCCGYPWGRIPAGKSTSWFCGIGKVFSLVLCLDTQMCSVCENFLSRIPTLCALLVCILSLNKRF